MAFRENVHIAALGFDVERIVAPVIDNRASRIYIIAREKDDKAKKNFDVISNQLKKRKIEVIRETCDHRSVFLLLKKYREIMEKERNSAVSINVSCGSKITAIAGMMACMMFRDLTYSIEPYYARMYHYASQRKKNKIVGGAFQEAWGYEDTDILDKYVIPIPEKHHIDTLTILRNGNSWEMKKKDLLSGLVDCGLIKQDEDFQQKRSSSKAGKNPYVFSPKDYATLKQKFIKPLKEKWEAIVVEEGKGGSIRVTPKGKNILLFLEGFDYKAGNHTGRLK